DPLATRTAGAGGSKQIRAVEHAAVARDVGRFVASSVVAGRVRPVQRFQPAAAGRPPGRAGAIEGVSSPGAPGAFGAWRGVPGRRANGARCAATLGTCP